MIEIFLPLGICLTCLILSAFVVVVIIIIIVVIISLREQILVPRTYSTGFFLWVSLSFSSLITHTYEYTL